MIALGLFAAFVAFSTTYYLVPLMIQVAHRLHILDNPDGKLKQHKQPTPYLGGVAVYGGLITALALAMPFCVDFIFLIIGLTVLLFVGLIDDLIALTPFQKIVGQGLAGLCFLKGGFYLKSQFLLTYDSGLYVLLIASISLLWILTIINSINLVDVMDGLATTIGICCVSMFAFFAWYFKNPAAFIASAAFIGSLISFFNFNKPRAQIYLGDAGSLLIGGFLAAIPSMISWGAYDSLGFLTPIIILFIPFAELGTLILVRFIKGIPFYNGSPDHFSHYLTRAGWKVYPILAYVTVWSMLLFVVAFCYATHTISLRITLFIGVLAVAIWWYVLFYAASTAIVAFDLFFVSLQHRYAKSSLFVAFRVLHNLMQK